MRSHDTGACTVLWLQLASERSLLARIGELAIFSGCLLWPPPLLLLRLNQRLRQVL